MPFANSKDTKYFYFERIREAGLVHGIFSRHGGVSPSPWLSLNTGSRVGDDPAHVYENLSRAARSLAREPESLVGVRQVHGNQVYRVEERAAGNRFRQQFAPFDSPYGQGMPEADAMITRRTDVTLFMRFADCVPLVFYDPVNRAAGVAHAGWQGTVKKVAYRIIAEMIDEYGSRPGDILAGVGPSICVDHYGVGKNVVDEARKAFGENAADVLLQGEMQLHFDLWKANRLVLEQAGVTQVEMSSECTFEQPDVWFSHRGEKGRTGRFVAMVGIGELNNG